MTDGAAPGTRPRAVLTVVLVCLLAAVGALVAVTAVVVPGVAALLVLPRRYRWVVGALVAALVLVAVGVLGVAAP